MTRGASRRDLVLYLETFVHTVGVMQTREALDAGGTRVRRGPRGRRRRLRGGALRARSCTWSAASRSIEVVEAVHEGFRQGSEGRPDPRPDAAHRDAHRGAQRGDRGARRPVARPRASAASTSRAPRPATRRPATSTRSSSSGARTSTSRSTPARRSGCPRSGRPCSCAARSGSATACGSSTTSRWRPTERRRSAALVARP